MIDSRIKSKLNLTIELLTPYRKELFKMLLISILISFSSAALDPLLFKSLIDSIQESNMNAFVLFAMGGCLIGVLIRFAIHHCQIINKEITNKLHKDLCLKMTKSYFHYSTQDVYAQNPAYYVSRIYDEPKQLARIVSFLMALSTSLFSLFIALIIAYHISWHALMSLTFFVPIVVYLSDKYSHQIMKLTSKQYSSEAHLKGVINSTLMSFKHVRMFELSNKAISNLNTSLDLPLNDSLNTRKCTSLFEAKNNLLMSLSEIFIITFSGFLVIFQKITMGSLFALSRSFMVVIQSLKTLTSLVPMAASLWTSLERYHEFIQAQEGQEAFKQSSGTITAKLSNIQLLRKDKTILNDFNLSLYKNDRLLISGENGAGKSSLLQLIVGHLKAQKGDINRPPSSRISYLLKDTYFLPGTMRQNIDYIASEPKVYAKAQTLLLALEIKDHLDKYPSQLSEGLLKKFQIFFALLKEADLYVFDEPLVNIDQLSKNTVMDTIFRFTQNSTLVAVLHGDQQYRAHFNKDMTLSSKNQVCEQH